MQMNSNVAKAKMFAVQRLTFGKGLETDNLMYIGSP